MVIAPLIPCLMLRPLAPIFWVFAFRVKAVIGRLTQIIGATGNRGYRAVLGTDMPFI